MKQKIKKLNKALKLVEKCSKKRAVLKVYLSIVLLGYRIPAAASYFKLKQMKVQSALTICGIRLQKDADFRARMHKAARMYMFEEQLELAA
tara:strand:+ start:21783 stop:22055 length:273 start_codon:yes stop_codon:yes gene_type:complete